MTPEQPQPTQAQIEAAEPRYKLVTGKFGPYFFDTRDDSDMPLSVVLERLNAAAQGGEQPTQAQMRTGCLAYEVTGLVANILNAIALVIQKRLDEDFTTTPTQAAKDLVYRFEHESAALHRIQRDWLVKEITALIRKMKNESKIPKRLIRPDGGLYDLPDELQKWIAGRK